MSIVINPTVSHVVTPSATPTPTPIVLQPGSVITAKVLQVLGGNTVQIAIGGQPINVQSQVPLQAGQTLQLAVSQTSDGVRLAVVNQQAAAAPSPGPSVSADATAVSDSVTLAPDAVASIASQTTPAVAVPTIQLTPQEALAVSAAAQTAATQQTSLANLFADLGVAAGLDTLPPQVQQAIAQVLTQRLSLDQNLTGQDIQQAFQASGLFLEASLASGSVSSSTATPDLKAALIVLRQVLTTSLASVPASVTAPAVVLSQGAAPAVVTTQQGTTTPVAAQPGAPGIVVPPTALAAAGEPGATLVAAVAAQGTAPIAIVLEQGPQPAIQVALVGPETPVAAAPALAPLLASEIAAPQVLVQGVALPAQPNIPNLSALSQLILPALTTADTTALAAASSATLTLLQEAVQSGPLMAGNLSRLVFNNGTMLSLLPALAGARTSKVDDGEIARANVPPPPIRGALPTAQPVVAATLVSNSPAETAMHHLIAETDGAIARQTLLQVASLPDRVDGTAARPDTSGPRWNFEIPFATPQGTAMAQFEISRESGGEVEAAKRVWRARFSLNVEPAGPVHALISFAGDRTSVRMWAERPATAAQLRAGAAELSQALSRADLVPGDIVIRDGAPLQAAPARAGHFLDRAL
jgi:Flagellar hook-length control protein FliK